MKHRAPRSPVRRSLVAWTAARIFYAACQWGILSVLARLTPPSDVGKFGLAFAVTAPVVMLANMNIGLVQSTDVDGAFCFREYLGYRVASQAVALLVISVLAVFYHDAAVIIVLVGLAKVFESFCDLSQSYLHLHGRSDLAARTLVERAALSVSAVYLGARLGGITGGVAALALAWGLGGATLLYRIAVMEAKQQTPRSILPSFDPVRMIALLRLGLPVGLMSAMGSLRTNTPRYFVESYLGYEALGYFTALSYLLVAANVIMQAVSQVVTPRLAELFHSGMRREAISLTRKLFGLGALGAVALTIGAHFAGSVVLQLLYGEAYSKFSRELTAIISATIFTYIESIGAASVAAARRFRLHPFIAMVGLGTAFLASYLLVARFGIMGAVISVMLGSAAEAVLYLVVCTRPSFGILEPPVAVPDRMGK